MALGTEHLIIGGVTKSATTSLFSYLAQHPEIRPSDVKETNYFIPARFDQPIAPPAVYASHFRGGQGEPITMEASPGYFYGGRRIADAIAEQVPAATVVLSFRDPVSRLKSFFHFHKEKALLPPHMKLSAYLAQAQTYSLEDFRTEPTLERWFGVAGGTYDAYFPAWRDTLGPRLLVTWFDDIERRPYDVVDGVTRHMGLHSLSADRYVFNVENRTVVPRFAALHQGALRVNTQLEPFLRRHMRLKALIRSGYRSVNAASRNHGDIDISDEDLRLLFSDSEARFVAQLSESGYPAPRWTAPATR